MYFMISYHCAAFIIVSSVCMRGESVFAMTVTCLGRLVNVCGASSSHASDVSINLYIVI